MIFIESGIWHTWLENIASTFLFCLGRIPLNGDRSQLGFECIRPWVQSPASPIKIIFGGRTEGLLEATDSCFQLEHTINGVIDELMIELLRSSWDTLVHSRPAKLIKFMITSERIFFSAVVPHLWNFLPMRRLFGPSLGPCWKVCKMTWFSHVSET